MPVCLLAVPGECLSAGQRPASLLGPCVSEITSFPVSAVIATNSGAAGDSFLGMAERGERF